MNHGELERVARNLERLGHSPLGVPQSSLDFIRDHLSRNHDLLSMVNPSLRLALQQRALEDTVRRLTDLVSPHTIIGEIIERQFSAASLVEQIVQRQRSTFEQIIGPLRDLASDFPSSIAASIEGANTWSSAIEGALNRFNELGLLGRRDDYIARLLAPADAFTSFVEAASKRLDSLTTPWHLAVGNTAFEVIQDQYDAIARTWSHLPLPVDELLSPVSPTLEAPYAQFDDALRIPEDENAEPDRAYLIAKVRSIRCVDDSQMTLDQVFRANEVSAGLNRAEIFKPTSRFSEACATLPWIIASDKRSFGDLLDALYFIFYEAPGKDHLRFRVSEGGTLDDDDCDFIWIVKHLRNKYARHDPNHGKPGDIVKSWEQLQEKWIALGAHHAPYQAEHFLAAQEALMRMAREFMEKLLASMTKGTVH